MVLKLNQAEIYDLQSFLYWTTSKVYSQNTCRYFVAVAHATMDTGI